MKRTKRKYTRKATTTPVESKSSGIGVEGSVIAQVSLSGGIPDSMVLPDSVTTSTEGEFTFVDLPLSLRMQIDSVTKTRARAHLPDNIKERTEQTIKWFKGDKPRYIDTLA